MTMINYKNVAVWHKSINTNWNVIVYLLEDNVSGRQLPIGWNDDDVITADRCVLPWRRHWIQVNNNRGRRYNFYEKWSFDDWRDCHPYTQQQQKGIYYYRKIFKLSILCIAVMWLLTSLLRTVHCTFITYITLITVIAQNYTYALCIQINT